MKILLIEDDREAASYLIQALDEAGHVTHHASDGETGYAMASSMDYDVLIVDRMLPRRDGLSTIEAAAMLVSRLENRPEIEAALTASFENLLANYRAKRR